MAFQIAARTSLFVAVSMAVAAGCTAGEDAQKSDLGIGGRSPNGVANGVDRVVSVTNLTADQPGAAPNVAASMVNAWGVVLFDKQLWIADNATGKITILDGKGEPSTGTPASGAIDLGVGITGVAVTGLAADAAAFPIHTADAHGPALLIFASETGQLFGVNPNISITGGVMVVDQSSVGASYKGVAVIQGRTRPLLLAADFFNARIDVFDENFTPITTVAFEAPPALPAGFAPFNVMAFGETVYVTYAQQDPDKQDEVAGPGLGFVAAFDVSGQLLGVAEGSALNAPWGLALADNFGPFANALLVGNFGDGRITAIETPDTAIETLTLKVLGQVADRDAMPIAIEGLWGLSFGGPGDKARPDGLYFAAGPGDEKHGLFGVITPAPSVVP